MLRPLGERATRSRGAGFAALFGGGLPTGEITSALGALPEAGGTLLDRSCVLGTSDVAGGSDHAMNDYPILVAGGAGGALKSPGVHVSLAGDNAVRGPFTALKAVGVPIDSLGTDQFVTSAPVAEILA